MEDPSTGERIPIERRGNLYHMRMWVRAAPPEVEAAPFGQQA